MIRTLVILGVSLVSLLLIITFSACAQADKASLKTITPRQAAELIAQKNGDQDFIILDIRTLAEFKDGYIKNAKLLDYYSKSFVDNLKRLDKTKTYLIYCRSGNRSGKTLSLIKDMGFKEVYNMGNGIKGWRSAGFLLIK